MFFVVSCLEERGIPFEREVGVAVVYRDKPLRPHRVDLIVGDQVVVEVKAVEELDRIHRAQIISYLRATGLRVGLLMNFNSDYLKDGLRRVVL